MKFVRSCVVLLLLLVLSSELHCARFGSSAIWTRIPLTENAPSPRFDASSATISNNLISIFGGKLSNFKATDSLFLYDVQQNSWTNVSREDADRWPSKRYDAAAVSEPYIVIGGANKPYYPCDAWSLSFTNKRLLNLQPDVSASASPPSSSVSWTLLNAFNPLLCRFGHAATTRNNADSKIIVVFGGLTNQTGKVSNDLIMSKDQGKTWSLIQPLGSSFPPARMWTTATYIEDLDSIAVFAGVSASVPLQDMWLYVVGSNKWEQVQYSSLSPVPQVRSGHNAYYDKINKRFVVFGGEGEDTQGLGDLWSFDFGTRSWEPIGTKASAYPSVLGASLFTEATQQVGKTTLHLFGGVTGWKQNTTITNELWKVEIQNYSKKTDKIMRV